MHTILFVDVMTILTYYDFFLKVRKISYEFVQELWKLVIENLHIE